MNAEKMAIACASLGGLVLLGGCSTAVNVANLSPALKAGDRVDGIPFRSKERYQIKLYRLVGGKYDQVQTNETYASLANQDQLYVLRMKGSALSDGTVKVKINPDNTLSFVSVDSASKGQEALTELGNSAKQVADARAARAKARVTAGKDTETATSGAEDGRVAATDAHRDAVIAQLELESLPEGTSVLDRTKAEFKVSRARIVANQMARRAELPVPFPAAGV